MMTLLRNFGETFQTFQTFHCTCDGLSTVLFENGLSTVLFERLSTGLFERLSTGLLKDFALDC